MTLHIVGTRTLEPDYGDVQVGLASEYADLPAGFVIEEFGTAGWAIPDWEERGLAHLAGVFPSREAAIAALRDA